MQTSSKFIKAVAGVALAATTAGVGIGQTTHADDSEPAFDSVIAVDTEGGSVTLPLFEGRHDGATVWYVVTESSNPGDARRRGVNEARPLRNALGTRAVQRATEVNGVLDFAGTVDFAPERIIVPGPDLFPPAAFQAGAVGDADYSPLTTVDPRTVINATHVANASGLHDAVIDIDYARRQVTLDTLNGFYEDDGIQYLHQEASVELVAALEGSTWAPNLDFAPAAGVFDRKASARAAIIPIVNGERGVGNPERQGLQSAVAGEGDPLNVTQVEPGDKEYTPVWDVSPVAWTQEAIDDGRRVRLTDHEVIADLFDEGLLVSAGTGPANESLEGIRALPGISNCPIVIVFDA